MARAKKYVETAADVVAETKIVKAYKGFDKNLCCRGHQFEIGGTYSVDGDVKACTNGFHACEYPIAVFEYYPAADGTRYCEVELSGDMDEEDDKIAARTIRVVRELTLTELVNAAVAYTVARAKNEEGATASGDKGAATASGDKGAATASGKYAGAYATGIGATVSGDIGCALHLDERVENWGQDDHGKIIAVWAGIVGQNGIKPNTAYRIVNGLPVEVV